MTQQHWGRCPVGIRPVPVLARPVLASAGKLWELVPRAGYKNKNLRLLGIPFLPHNGCMCSTCTTFGYPNFHFNLFYFIKKIGDTRPKSGCQSVREQVSIGKLSYYYYYYSLPTSLANGGLGGRGRWIGHVPIVRFFGRPRICISRHHWPH